MREDYGKFDKGRVAFGKCRRTNFVSVMKLRGNCEKNLRCREIKKNNFVKIFGKI